MLTRPQLNLLRWLAGFPESMESAWDVPRELSLPGLADAMGVVRSGLNAPLKVLEAEGFVTKRMAHVVGGGTRRRHVHHITQAGRAWLVEHEQSPNSTGESTKPSIHTNHPVPEPTRSLIGRDKALAEALNLLSAHRVLHIQGMSGIGKTAFGRAIASNFREARWATADAFSDAESLAAAWCPEQDSWPSNTASMVEFLVLHAGENLLMLDDLHSVPPRHIASVEALLHGLSSAGMNLVTLAKPPIDFDAGWPLIQLDALDPSEAMDLLPEHIDEPQRLAIAKALGGHPMALHLHQEGSALPEAGEGVQSYISTTVLSGLDEPHRRGLDAMVLFPRPLSIHHVPHGDVVGGLDDHALLRWDRKEGRVEVQHVVRNVRRAMLSGAELDTLHLEAAAHWSAQGTTDEHQVLWLYHELAAGGRPEGLEERVEAVLPTQHRTLAVVLEGATASHGQDETLHFLAGKVALHRMELDRVRHHMDQLSQGDRHRRLAHSLALAEGNIDEATSLLDSHSTLSSPVEAAKLLLSSAVQSVEDRVFDEPVPVQTGTVTAMLERIVLPKEPAIRTPLMVSMALIRHALALSQQRLDTAVSVRESLAALTHDADPLLQAMLLREDLQTHQSDDEGLVERIESVAAVQSTPFHGTMIRMAGVEHLVNQGHHQPALNLFARLSKPRSGAHRGQAWYRYSARWWYVRGHLFSEERRASLREASVWFRRAGCHQAAESVIARLHRVL